MAFTEDLDEFLDDDDFAIAATYTPFGYPRGSSKDVPVFGINNQQYVEYENISGVKPTFLIKTSDVSDIQQDAKLSHSGTNYLIKEWEPDGTGFTLLILEEQDY